MFEFLQSVDRIVFENNLVAVIIGFVVPCRTICAIQSYVLRGRFGIMFDNLILDPIFEFFYIALGGSFEYRKIIRQNRPTETHVMKLRVLNVQDIWQG